MLNFPGPYVDIKSTGKYYDLYKGKENQNKYKIVFKNDNGDIQHDGEIIFGFLNPQVNDLKESYLDVALVEHGGYILIK